MMLDLVRTLLADVPGVVEQSSYGTPGFKVKKKLFARIHQSEEAVVVRVPQNRRGALVRSDPATFYVTDHYRDHPWVLVRPTVDVGELRELLLAAWRSVAPAPLVRELDTER